MRAIDFSNWQAIASTLLGIVLVSLLGVGIRLVVMMAVQQRRERENRQINERLKTLIAAYKTLGGSFTGDLMVDPRHLRDMRKAGEGAGELTRESGDRARRIRDAAESALSDVLLLGTEEQVQLAARAASDLVAGRPVETAALVVSLRDFIREVLDLEAVSPNLSVPKQGPARPDPGGKGKGKGDGERGGGGKGGGGGMGMGMGMGFGGGGVEHDHHDDEHE